MQLTALRFGRSKIQATTLTRHYNDNPRAKGAWAYGEAMRAGRYHKSEGYHERCTEEILSELLEMNFNAKQVEAFFERRGGITDLTDLQVQYVWGTTLTTQTDQKNPGMR